MDRRWSRPMASAEGGSVAKGECVGDDLHPPLDPGRDVLSPAVTLDDGDDPGPSWEPVRDIPSPAVVLDDEGLEFFDELIDAWIHDGGPRSRIGAHLVSAAGRARLDVWLLSDRRDPLGSILLGLDET